MYSDDEIKDVTERMEKARSKHYKRAADMILRLEGENRMLREGIVAALRLREIGLAEEGE